MRVALIGGEENAHAECAVVPEWDGDLAKGVQFQLCLDLCLQLSKCWKKETGMSG